jgi:hypothetical protein
MRERGRGIEIKGERGVDVRERGGETKTREERERAKNSRREVESEMER